MGFEVGFLVRLVGLLGSTWWACSEVDFLVRLVGLLSSTWWDFLSSEVGLLGSKVGLLDLLGLTCLRLAFLGLRFFFFFWVGYVVFLD